MNLAEPKSKLASSPDLYVRFWLPNNEAVPAHAHVTEVARIDKSFVDCGGTFRKQSFCRLQTWVSDDSDHRLTAGTLLKILQKGASFLQTDALEVDVEHEMNLITRFPLSEVEPNGKEILFRLSPRHAECLAAEKCKPRPSILDRNNPMKLQFKAAS